MLKGSREDDPTALQLSKGGLVIIPLDNLIFGTNPPAGMDLSVIGHWTMLMRKTAEPVDPPITASVACTHCGTFRVTDGRHRVFGSLIAGRTHIQASQ